MLSEYLKQYIDELDEAGYSEYIYGTNDESEAKKEAKDEAARFAKRLAADYIKPRVKFAESSVSPILRHFLAKGRGLVLQVREPPEFLEWALDMCYTREVLRLIPKLVKRTMKLSFILPGKFPSDPTNVFLREASRAYIFGFWQASVAMSRAALEQGLRDRLRDRLGGGAEAKLYQLVKMAVGAGLLDKTHSELANKVELAGNEILHGKPGTDRTAWEALLAARGALVHLFSAEAI
jgi:hypothetical protein